MKGQIQIINGLLVVFAVGALFIALIATDIRFTGTLVSSQQDDLNAYQSRLYMHTMIQDKGLVDSISKYTYTGRQEPENEVEQNLREILGTEEGGDSYRATVEPKQNDQSTLKAQISNNDRGLSYTQILVPSPETNLYKLEIGSKAR